MNQTDKITMFMAYVIAIAPYLFAGIACYFFLKLLKKKKKERAIKRNKERQRTKIAEEAKIKIRMIKEMYEER